MRRAMKRSVVSWTRRWVRSAQAANRRSSFPSSAVSPRGARSQAHWRGHGRLGQRDPGACRVGHEENISDYAIPSEAQGAGLWEAPRGALGHWNRIQGGRLANYQVITPTCWNISPRDGHGILGPIEQALIGTPVADPKQPLEILRVAHSFDPCLACTVHVIDPQTKRSIQGGRLMSTATEARARPSAPESKYEYRWNLAYRVDHWVRVAAIVVLTVTGFYIHRPPTRFPGYDEGRWPELMSWMHFAHFVAGYVFTARLVTRVYRAFNSTFDADWRDFVSWRTIRDIPECTLYLLCLRKTHKKYRRYDPLQALSYLFMAVVAVVQMLTGFALYHEHGSVFGLSADSFRWVRDCLGATQTRGWCIMGACGPLWSLPSSMSTWLPWCH